MPTEDSKNPESLCRHSRLQIVFAITLIGVIVTSIISPMSKVRAHFGISSLEVGLLITAFAIPGFLTFFIGVLTDRFGRRQILVPSLFLFGGAGALCAISPNFTALVVLRFIQGVGAAGLIPIAQTLIGDYYDGVERAGAMGANTAVMSIGIAIGMASSSLISEGLGGLYWGAPFLLSFLAVPVGLLSLLYLPNPEISRTSLGTYMGQVKDLVISPGL